MPDNLSVSITADTSKLRAELKLAQQELKNLAAAETAAVKAGDVAEVNKTSAAYETQRRQVAALNTEYRKLTKSTDEAGGSLKELIHSGRGLGRVVGEFSNLSRGVESLTGILGVLTGGFVGGLAGVAVARAFSFLTEQINVASEALDKLRKQAAELGIKPIALQAAQDVVSGIGEDAAVATQMLKGMNAQIEEARKKSTQAAGGFGVSVAKGGAGGAIGDQGAFGVRVGRGGVAPPSDFAAPLSMIGAPLAGIPNDRLELLKSYTVQLKAFVEAGKTFDATALNIISKTLFSGVPTESALKVAPELLKKWQEEIDALSAKASGATAKHLAEDAELRISQDALTKQYTESMASIAEGLAPIRIAINNFLVELLKLPSSWDPIGDAWKSLWAGMVDTVVAAANRIAAIWQSTKAALGAAALSNPEAAIAPFASGGMVRGAGGDTSDSILARLSNGEFVMRAAAVRHWGADMMQALNAAGSDLLPRSTRRRGFAAGGMVTATTSDGVTVNLHFPGGNFSLHGDKAIVAGLTREARRAGMLSASRMPAFA